MARQDIESLLPTDDDVALYRERGYYVSGLVLPDEVIDEAVRGTGRHFAGERHFNSRWKVMWQQAAPRSDQS